MRAPEPVRRELEQAALGACGKVDELRAQLQREHDPVQRKALKIRIAAAADEHARVLTALFASEPSNSR